MNKSDNVIGNDTSNDNSFFIRSLKLCSQARFIQMATRFFKTVI